VEGRGPRVPVIGKEIMVVPPSSATLNLGRREVVIDMAEADHHMVCKFRGADDGEYLKLIRAICEVARRD
jgi:hypothetical protein